jgi:hypothetical protein
MAKAVAAATATTQVQSNHQVDDDVKPENTARRIADLYDRYFSLVCFFIVFIVLAFPMRQLVDNSKESANVHWVCEYCGKTWDRERRLKKPLQYQLSRCNATESGIHSLVDRTSE